LAPKKKYKWLIITLSIIIIASIACVTAVYYALYRPNFNLSASNDRYIYIFENNKDFGALCRELTDSVGCRDSKTFEFLAQRLNYPATMRSGRYAVEPSMNNYSLLNRLRYGQQSPVRLTFNNIRLISDLAVRLTDQLMISSEELMTCLTDEALCDSLGFSTTTIGTLFIPDTYEVWWNISATKLLLRMKREYETFWNEQRRQKAANLRLSPIEVAILASIVEEETIVPDEYPIVAGLYVNRLFKGMPLQADPTVKFALGDFSLRRILFEHLETESPYNTYLHSGLPPGPIRIPSPRVIDAVLNRTVHNYLYMCAKDDFSGRHNFAATQAEHNRNAAAYHRELDRRGI